MVKNLSCVRGAGGREGVAPKMIFCRPYLIKKTTRGVGGGFQKSPILRRHSLWTAANPSDHNNKQLTLICLTICFISLAIFSRSLEASFEFDIFSS